jgi:hypothetical protein
VAWTVVYVQCVRVGLRDRTYAMPLCAGVSGAATKHSAMTGRAPRPDAEDALAARVHSGRAPGAGCGSQKGYAGLGIAYVAKEYGGVSMTPCDLENRTRWGPIMCWDGSGGFTGRMRRWVLRRSMMTGRGRGARSLRRWCIVGVDITPPLATSVFDLRIVVIDERNGREQIQERLGQVAA